MKVCNECGGLDKHLRSCSSYEGQGAAHWSKRTFDSCGSAAFAPDEDEVLDIPGLCDT